MGFDVSFLERSEAKDMSWLIEVMVCGIDNDSLSFLCAPLLSSLPATSYPFQPLHSSSLELRPTLRTSHQKANASPPELAFVEASILHIFRDKQAVS